MNATRSAVSSPALGVISLGSSGDGVSVVSRLLWQALESQWKDVRLLELTSEAATRATLAQKVRFAMQAATAQAAQRTDWVLFSHLGLAQVQHGIPAPLRQPYGVFLHGIEVWRPLTAREKRVLANAHLRLANSTFTARRVMERHPDIGPIEACPLALPAAAARKEAESADGSVTPLGPHAVLIVGRMVATERYKGHDELIDAWPHVVAEVPDAMLVVVGDGDDRPRLATRAAESPAAANILFTGFVSDDVLTAWYRRAALFALPSRGEGFGLVYLEAMEHRLACVGSVHDAAGDVIVDGATGALVDQNDTSGMAHVIASLLLDDNRRRAMGEAGYRRLHECFTFDRFANRLHQLITDAAAGGLRRALVTAS